MGNIWTRLKKPIWCLAPMYGVTDSAFRQMLCQIGKPDLMFTEFANVQALVRQLSYFPQEKPLICQLWGNDPELFGAAAELIIDLGFDGIDLNLGCAVKAVVKKGSGAALIDNPELAGQIIQATIKACRGRLPVSVKTRLGYKTMATARWFKFLLSFPVAAISVHCRTTKAMASGPTHWGEITKIVNLRNRLHSKTLIIGNGDIFSREMAHKRIKQTGVDGVMIGRGVLQNPWIFNPVQTKKTKAAKVAAWKQHLKIYRQTWGKLKPIHPMKRFVGVYLKGFSGALALRKKTMDMLS